MTQAEAISMNDRVVTFEGYDGSGKSTLIEALRDSYPEKLLRIVGRKTEPELRLISNAIEDAALLQPDAEIMLRFALETERQRLVRGALPANDLVILDRGIISVLAWFDYLRVSRQNFDALISASLKQRSNSLLVVCTADFETCWSRIESKPSLSKKERLGREVNRGYYDQYARNVNRSADAYGGVLFVDTTRYSLEESTVRVREELAKNGLP